MLASIPTVSADERRIARRGSALLSMLPCWVMRQSRSPVRTAGPPPSEEELHAAALAYLCRYAATEAGVRAVLARRVARWKLAALAAGYDASFVTSSVAAARETVARVAARLVAAGAVDDAAFAEARAGKLIRRGRSRRAIAAHLATKGINRATAQAALPEDAEAELTAALILARRRRLGPFRAGPADAATRRRDLGVLARAGFPEEVAKQALAIDEAAAATLLAALRRS